MHSPVEKYQILIVESLHPEYIFLSSDEIATEIMELECPSKTLMHSYVPISQIRNDLSHDPETSFKSSFEIAIHHT